MSAPRHNPDGGRQLYYGLYPAIVTDIVDPGELGRVEVRFPWLGTQGDGDVRAWATLTSPYAEGDQGLFVLPETETQVVVGFEAGQLHRPYVVGSCWNGQEAMPETPAAPNNVRLLKTRSGSELRFEDADGSEVVKLSTASGHELVLDNGSQEVVLTHSNGCVIKIDAAGKVDISANSSVDVNAPILNVHAGTANFDGLINCTTLVAKSAVSSPLYSTGAGNVW